MSEEIKPAKTATIFGELRLYQDEGSVAVGVAIDIKVIQQLTREQQAAAIDGAIDCLQGYETRLKEDSDFFFKFKPDEE